MNKNDSNGSMYTPEKENIIRQRWLVSFYMYAFWVFLYYGFFVALAFCRDVISNMMQKDNVAAGLLIVFMAITGYLLVHYYFGYKKKGTRLLAWLLIVGGLKFISKIPEIISDIKGLFIEFGLTNSIVNFSYILEISGICLVTYYLINSWKLYSLNSAIKYGNKKNATVADLAEYEGI